VTDVGYVVAGWSLTVVVLAGYYARIIVRTRRSSRSGEQQ
jgi:hypothetical protein